MASAKALGMRILLVAAAVLFALLSMGAYTPPDGAGSLSDKLTTTTFTKGETPLSGEVSLGSGDTFVFHGQIESLSEDELTPGQAYQIELPENIICPGKGLLSTIMLDDFPFGALQATDDGRVYFVVDAALNTNNAGYWPIEEIDLHFDVKLNMATIGGGQTIEIAYPGGTPLLTVSVTDNAPRPPAITGKSGALDAGTGRIDWTVSLAKEVVDENSPDGPQTGYVFTDILADSSQTYVAGTFAVKTAAGSDVTAEYGTLASSNLLTYTFDQKGIDRDLTITYSTSPGRAFHDAGGRLAASPGDVTIENTAALYPPGATDPSSEASDSVEISGEAWLAKTGKSTDYVNRTVTWEIKVSTNGLLFTEINLYDALPEGHTFVAGSLTLNGSATSANSGYTGKGAISETDHAEENKLLKLINANGQYTIEYKTAFAMDGHQNASITATNKAWLTYKIPDFGPGPDDAPYGIPVVEKPYTIAASSINKTGTYNAATRTITWTVEVNRNRADISSAALYDIFDISNQELVPGSLAVTKVNGADHAGQYPNAVMTALAALPAGVTRPNAYDSDSPAYAITLGAPMGTNCIVYTFQTLATDPAFYANNASMVFRNTAYVANGAIVSTGASNRTFTSEVLKKEGTAYDYSTKTITWKLTVNKNGYPLTNVTFEDVLPSYLQYVAESVKGLTGAQAATYDANTLTLRLGDISAQQTITFQTTLDVDAEALPPEADFLRINTPSDATDKCEISNAASLESNQYHGATANGKIAIANTAFEKTGVLNDDASIRYTIRINQPGADLYRVHSKPIVITDALPANASPDIASVKLYKATVTAAGAFVKGDEVTGLTVGMAEGVMTVTFPADLPGTSPYMLCYDLYTDGHGSFSNSATLGAESTPIDTGSVISITAAQAGGSARRSKKNCALELALTDSVTGGPVPGAGYKICEVIADEEYYMRTETTGTDGKLTFPLLTNGVTYVIYEVTTPQGYYPDPDAPHTLTLVAAYDDPHELALTRTPLPTEVAFVKLEANGSDTETTTTLTLTFDRDVDGLSADDITLTGAAKGTLTKVAGQTGVYALGISNITVADGETVTAAVSKDHFVFTPASMAVAVQTVNATISPTAASYDKYTASAGLSFTLAPGSYALTAIQNGIDPLVENTDYTVSNNVYTITQHYLDARAVGLVTLTFDMSGGADPTAAITISDSMPNAPAVTDPKKDTIVPVTVGDTATLKVTATDARGYQWWINRNDGNGWTEIVGATGSSYTTSPVTMANNGYRYYCVVSGAPRTTPATSPTFTLNVSDPPMIPETGDASMPLLWAGLLLLAAGLFVARRRPKRT